MWRWSIRWHRETRQQMDLIEASRVLDQHIRLLREIPYMALKRLVEGRVIEAPEIEGPSGARYYLEVQAFWDSQPDGNIRLVAAIDDGGIRAYRPLTRGFIKAPDGSFVGE